MSCSPGLQELQWEAVAQAAGMTIHAISVLNQGRCCAGWWALIQGFHHALLKHHKPTPRKKHTHIKLRMHSWPSSVCSFDRCGKTPRNSFTAAERTIHS